MSISQIIASVLTEGDQERFLDLIRVIGNGCQTRGLSRFYNFLKFSKSKRIVRRILMRELNLSIEDYFYIIANVKEELGYNDLMLLEDLKRELRQQRKESRKHKFVPYIYSNHLSSQQGLVTIHKVWLGNDFNLNPIDQEFELLKEKIDFLIELNENEFIGEITQFVYVPYPHIQVVFDKNSNVLSYRKVSFNLPDGYFITTKS